MNTFNDLVANINVYDLIGTCYSGDTPSDFMMYPTSKADSYKGYMLAGDYTPFLNRYKNNKNKRTAHQLGEVPPCVYAKPIQDYFHSESVKTAMHIPAEAPVWDYCLSDIDYTPLKGAS